MNLRVPVKCSKKLEENGGFAIAVKLPPELPGKDRLQFTAANEMTYLTHDRHVADEVDTGDILYIALFTADQIPTK